MSPTFEAAIEALYRYPVKGLSAEPLRQAQLSRGDYFPGDRMFAIENGPSGFDATAPTHQSKIKFLMLMRNARLARLRTRYDDASGELHIQSEGVEHAFEIVSEAGRNALASFFEELMPKELRGAPRLLEAPAGFRFTDSRKGFVSIINLASMAALEQVVGHTLDPLRFRANIYVRGWPAWHEFGLVGQTITIGDVRLRVTKRIERCAATDVDPQTGARDTDLPRTLLKTFDHTDCGVYAEVKQGGTVAIGNTVAEAAAATLPF